MQTRAIHPARGKGSYWDTGKLGPGQTKSAHPTQAITDRRKRRKKKKGKEKKEKRGDIEMRDEGKEGSRKSHHVFLGYKEGPYLAVAFIPPNEKCKEKMRAWS